MIKFTCPNCNQAISVDDAQAGSRGRCPKCRTVVVVPGHSTVIEFVCKNCWHKIKVQDRYAGKRGKCPKCGNALVVPLSRKERVAKREAPSSRLVAEAPTPVPTTVVSGESAKPDRRLVVLIAGVAVVIVVGLLGLVTFLGSPGSEPVAPPPPREIARTEPPPQPTVPETPPAEPTATPVAPVAPDDNDTLPLRFAPHPGDRQTLRLTTHTTMSIEQNGRQEDVTSTQSFSVDLEAGEAHADGTIPVTVTLSVIQVKTEADGVLLGEYDSAAAQSEGDLMAGIYVPFVGRHFAISVSEEGEIIDPGLDELFLAVAVGRTEAEDDMMREHLKEEAQTAIEKTDRSFGSRRERILAIKEKLEAFPSFGREELLSLLDHLIPALPAQPARSGVRWSGPIAVGIGTRLEMRGTYTLTAVEEDSCTVDAQGQRSLEDEPFIYQVGTTTVSNKLGGASQAHLTVDRRAGWLRRKTQETALRGRILTARAEVPGQGTFSSVAMEMTTTVVAIE